MALSSMYRYDSSDQSLRYRYHAYGAIYLQTILSILLFYSTRRVERWTLHFQIWLVSSGFQMINCNSTSNVISSDPLYACGPSTAYMTPRNILDNKVILVYNILSDTSLLMCLISYHLATYRYESSESLRYHP